MGNNVTYNIPFFPFIDFSLHISQNFMGHFYASLLIFVINIFTSSMFALKLCGQWVNKNCLFCIPWLSLPLCTRYFSLWSKEQWQERLNFIFSFVTKQLVGSYFVFQRNKVVKCLLRPKDQCGLNYVLASSMWTRPPQNEKLIRLWDKRQMTLHKFFLRKYHW